MFSLGGGSSLRIANTTLAQLSAGNFSFAPPATPELSGALVAEADTFAFGAIVSGDVGDVGGHSWSADGLVARLGEGFAFAGLAPAAAPDWMAAHSC